MAIQFTGRFSLLLLTTMLVAACAPAGIEAKDAAAFRKHPQSCTSDEYFRGLSNGEKVHYAFGALHARPQAPCIVRLLSTQDLGFLKLLQRELARRGSDHDLRSFVEAIALMRSSGRVTDQELEALGLEEFCLGSRDKGAECMKLVAKLRMPGDDPP